MRADVEAIIPQVLPHDGASASEVARRLGMSSRTLSRKLREQGVTYSEILDEPRAALAQSHLSDPDLPVSEIPALGRILDVPPAALYRISAHSSPRKSWTPNRGPGSGARASPETVAQFLIGLLTNASAEENVGFARSIGNARSANCECPLTGAKKLKDALAAVLTNEAQAKRVRLVELG